jgi:hypothetical protein
MNEQQAFVFVTFISWLGYLDRRHDCFRFPIDHAGTVVARQPIHDHTAGKCTFLAHAGNFISPHLLCGCTLVERDGVLIPIWVASEGAILFG